MWKQLFNSLCQIAADAVVVEQDQTPVSQGSCHPSPRYGGDDRWKRRRLRASERKGVLAPRAPRSPQISETVFLTCGNTDCCIQAKLPLVSLFTRQNQLPSCYAAARLRPPWGDLKLETQSAGLNLQLITPPPTPCPLSAHNVEWHSELWHLADPREAPQGIAGAFVDLCGLGGGAVFWCLLWPAFNLFLHLVVHFNLAFA